jgi:NADPH-dependent curcumin reductase CurA
MVQNKGLIFASYPVGFPVAGKDLVIEARELDISKAPEGGIIVKNHYVSFDPYQRGRLRRPEVASYAAAFLIGEPLTNRGVSTVVASGSSKFEVGQVVIVSGLGTGTEEYTVLSSARLGGVSLLKNPLGLDPAIFIGALGMPGLTAWSSFYEIGAPKKGETIFVSAASGAVGAIVGQLAKKEGLKVIGSVGDDAKLEYIIKELGFDGGFNYKKEKPIEALKRLVPEGIDIFYDNVGGEQLEAAITMAKEFARFSKLRLKRVKLESSF